METKESSAISAKSFKGDKTMANTFIFLINIIITPVCGNELIYSLQQWYSTFFVRVPPDIISLQLCTPKVVGT
jgi:hypothetical protein